MPNRSGWLGTRVLPPGSGAELELDAGSGDIDTSRFQLVHGDEVFRAEGCSDIMFDTTTNHETLRAIWMGEEDAVLEGHTFHGRLAVAEKDRPRHDDRF